MRVIGYIVGVLAAIVDLVLIIISLTVPEDSMWGGVVALTIIVVGLFYSLRQAKKVKAAQKAMAEAQSRPHITDEGLAVIEGGGLIELHETPLTLEEGEVAHYYAPAIRYVTKTRVVGHTGGGAGVSVRVAKGVSVRTGGGSSRAVRGDVTDTFVGDIVLSNRRLVFVHAQGGFECRLNGISLIQPDSDGVLIQAGSKTFQIAVARQDLFEKVLQTVSRQ